MTVSDVVDFYFRYLQPHGHADESVWLMSNYRAQQLRYWHANPTLQGQVRDAKLFEDGGCCIIFMAWCESSHFFGCVAVCGEQPTIYILESIGGYSEPSGVAFLSNFLLEIRSLKNLPPVEIKIVTSDVPRQTPGSNNCGLFLLHSAEQVLTNPKHFLRLAEENLLGNWYPSSSVSKKREQIAQLIQRLATEQRMPGGVNQSLEKLNLPNLNFKVRSFI